MSSSIINKIYRLSVLYAGKILKRNFVKNVFKKKYKKKVLISYIAKPFRKKSMDHTNFFEAVTVAETFDLLGYQVDVIQYNVLKQDVGKYDVIFGFGESVEHFYSSKYNDQTKVICYSTGMHQFFQNVETLKRIKTLQKDSGVWLINSARLTDFSWFRQLVMSDAVITLGNIEVKKTFAPYYTGQLYPLNAPFYKVRDYKMLGTKSGNAHKTYIWFGSSGLVHKGLDLCLEFFKSHEDLTLHICGPIEGEPDFISHYYDELHNTSNIINHGFVDINSEEFDEILRSSFFAIFPSCSEGGAPSLLTVIGNGGMIPVMTKTSSIDVPNVCYIDELTIAGVNNAVIRSQSIPKNELVLKSTENAEFVIKNNSLERYREKLKKIIKEILN